MEAGQVVNPWLLVLNGEMSGERREALVREAAATLDERLEEIPGIEARVGEIITLRLAGGVTVDTWGALQERLEAFLGTDVAWLFWTCLLNQDVRDETERLASPEAVTFLKTLSLIYGPDLQKVFSYSNENPDDWALVQRNYYWEAGGLPRISIVIEKYDGERMRIAGPPDSALNLASAMMDLCTNVAVESFNPATLRHFQDRVAALLEHLEEDRVTEDPWGELPGELDPHPTAPWNGEEEDQEERERS